MKYRYQFLCFLSLVSIFGLEYYSTQSPGEPTASLPQALTVKSGIDTPPEFTDKTEGKITGIVTRYVPKTTVDFDDYSKVASGQYDWLLHSMYLRNSLDPSYDRMVIVSGIAPKVDGMVITKFSLTFINKQHRLQAWESKKQHFIVGGERRTFSDTICYKGGDSISYSVTGVLAVKPHLLTFYSSTRVVPNSNSVLLQNFKLP